MGAYSFDYWFARKISLVEVLVRSRKDEQHVCVFLRNTLQKYNYFVNYNTNWPKKLQKKYVQPFFLIVYRLPCSPCIPSSVHRPDTHRCGSAYRSPPTNEIIRVSIIEKKTGHLQVTIPTPWQIHKIVLTERVQHIIARHNVVVQHSRRPQGTIHLRCTFSKRVRQAAYAEGDEIQMLRSHSSFTFGCKFTNLCPNSILLV